MTLLKQSMLALLLLPALPQAAEPISNEQFWEDRYAVTASEPHLTIDNIWGDVNVKAGGDGEIRVAIRELRSAPTLRLYDLSLDLLVMEVEADERKVVILVDEPGRHWRRRNPCRGCRLEYTFDVTVPAATTLDLGTVNDGRVTVEGVQGVVSARNVNGPIALAGLHNCSEIDSVNGRVRLDFARGPALACRIETINGDITATLPAGAGLDIAANLFNGRLVSELAVEALALPAKVRKSEDSGRTRYSIEQAAGLRVGPGGPTFSVESLNGDIRIKQRNN